MKYLSQFAFVVLTLTFLGAPGWAGEFQCLSSSQRHHLALSLHDGSNVVFVNHEGNVLKYQLSEESQARSRRELPLILESTHGDMRLRIHKDQSGAHLLGIVKLRIIGENVSLVCQYLVANRN